MEKTSFTSATDGLEVQAYRWAVDDPVATVQLAHGLAEHAPRYARLADALNAAGFEVWANDHRGHGASVGDTTPLGDFGAGGWAGLIADIVQFSGVVAEARPGLAHFLVGHSMGSFAAQSVFLADSARFDGVVLSGSTAIDRFAASLPEPEPGQPGDLSAFNQPFAHRTGYEWLSRDAAEVDKYVADPLCGFETSPEVLPSMLSRGAELADASKLSAIRSDLPILILAGDADPLNAGGALLELLAERYRDAGVADVELTLYPGGRHEMFNETNRDDVTGDVIDWLRARVT